MTMSDDPEIDALLETGECPNCDDGDALVRVGVMVGCKSCFGMWAPVDLAETVDSMVISNDGETDD